MAFKPDQTIRLNNGRQLGYAEFGDPQGRPVLHFHGMPSCRMEGSLPALDEIATRLGARVLLPERPGFGLSDFWPYRIDTWPEIALEFARLLGYEDFAVMGLSSGGKYVAACAWKIPERLPSATIISGNAPMDVPEAAGSMTTQDRQLYTLARRAPWLLRLLLWQIARGARKDPQSIFKLFAEVSPPDRAALEQPEIRQLLADMVAGAFQSGTRGVAWDWKLEALPWGFPLSDVRMPVAVWHGEQDRLVPVEHGCYMASALPLAQPHIVPYEGHISLISRHYEAILRTALS